MMNKITFELAKDFDDEALQKIIVNNPMDGEIQISFQRRPSYFYAEEVKGKFYQIIVAKDNQNIIATGTRSIRPLFINGKVIDVGYLSDLRINKSYRNKTTLAKGYQYLYKLHQDKKVSIYITTIIEDNIEAINILTSKRVNLPAYHDIGRYCTMAISLFRKKKGLLNPDFEIVRGCNALLREIVDCMQRNGQKRQFYPFYTIDDFTSLRDFDIHNFYVAVKNNKVIGVLARWDQRSFKQNIVTGYKGKIKIIKPFYNLGAYLFGFSKLPQIGTELKSFYISFIAIDSDDLQVFRRLLRAVYNDSIGADYSYFLVGLHSQDPLLKIVEEYHHIKYNSRLYVVCWEDGENLYKNLDNRIPYLEIATL